MYANIGSLTLTGGQVVTGTYRYIITNKLAREASVGLHDVQCTSLRLI